MPLQFKRTYDFHSEFPPSISPSNLVECIVGRAGYGDSGQVETLRSEVNVLTEIVSRLASKLPERDLIELAELYGYTPY